MDNTSAGSEICSLNIFCSDRPRGPSSTIGMVFEAMEHIWLMPAMMGKVNSATILEGCNEVSQSDSVMQPVHDKEPERLTSDVIVEAPPAAQMVVADTAVEISDTSTTMRIEDENPDAMASDKTYYIQKVEVHGLGHLPMKYQIYLKITVGETPYMTSAYRMPSRSIPYWAHPINLGSHDDSIIVKFKLFQNPKTPLMRKASLGSAEKKISDFPRSGGRFFVIVNICLLIASISADRTISLKMNNKPVSSLKVFFSNDIRRVMEGVVQYTPAPKTSLDGIGKLLDAMEPIEKVIDMIADAHPATKIAWNIVSMGTNLLRKKKETNEIVTKLYNLKSVYDTLFQHTIECSIFIKGYVENKSWAGRLSRAFLSSKAEEFCDGFQDLRDQLLLNIVAEDLAVTLAMLEKVEEIDMHQLLQDLRPWTSLGPKSTCMKGTRVATINYLMDWIADCNGGMMWCSGLAGTGKSSLVGETVSVPSFAMIAFNTPTRHT
ncbi:hypothetical protein ARMSODRAFT_1019665 [Armillaria solidipes]|uniref:Uncharacterized protein n=1 Tax=Armillaria solidipes TaxID=1076256 RepID=A0A2H3BCE9_9AGAR|nr:hypothetical protein ARMSODRAFT_1019665 [Armillaria solidipes]